MHELRKRGGTSAIGGLFAFYVCGILVLVVYSTKKDSPLVVIFLLFFIQILFSCFLAFDPDFSLITQIYILSLFQIDRL